MPFPDTVGGLTVRLSYFGSYIAALAIFVMTLFQHIVLWVFFQPGWGRGGVGQLGMAHRSDGPASSLRMFGHVHRAMCGGGCQFEVLEEHACT